MTWQMLIFIHNANCRYNYSKVIYIISRAFLKNRLCGQVHAVFTANLIRKAGQPTLASAKY